MVERDRNIRPARSRCLLDHFREHALRERRKRHAVRLNPVTHVNIASMWGIADYDAMFDPIRQARQDKSGKQLGDPLKAARAILELVASENPPAHLLCSGVMQSASFATS